MGYSNNIITAPVGIGDVSQALSNSSTDLGTLCSSNSIKKWAKYKPEHWSVDTHPPIGFLTDSQRQQNHYGLEWFKYKDPGSGNSIDIADWRTLMLGTICNGLYYYNERNLIEGSATALEPKRIADFLRFSNESTTPVSNCGYYTGAIGPISSGSVVQGVWGGQGWASLSLTFSPANTNTIGFSDFVNISSGDSLYYGVLFLQYDEEAFNSSNYTNAYEMLNETNNPIYNNVVTLVWHIDTQSTPADIPTWEENNSFVIDADDIYRAGLTPVPYHAQGSSQWTKHYYYVIVPVLFRGGVVNNLNAGFCTYPLNFDITGGTDINNIRALPLPVSSSYFKPEVSGAIPFMAKFGAVSENTPDLQIVIVGFEGYQAAQYSPNVVLSATKIMVTGADSGYYNRGITIDFYHDSDPQTSYTPINTFSATIQDDNVEESKSTSLTTTWNNLRCRVYLTDTPSKYSDVRIIDYMTFSE